MLPDDYDLPPYDGPTVELVIEHDPADEEKALLLARRLFAELDVLIGALTLVPADGAEFAVTLDGERVYAQGTDGGEPSALALSKLAWTRLNR